MLHNVYARIAVPFDLAEDDGGTWLATDLEHDIEAELEPLDLEVEVCAEADEPGTVEVEINFVSYLESRRIWARLEELLDKHEPVDSLIGVD